MTNFNGEFSRIPSLEVRERIAYTYSFYWKQDGHRGSQKQESLLLPCYVSLSFVCFVFVMFSSRDKEKQGHVKRFFAAQREFQPEVLSIWRRCHWENCLALFLTARRQSICTIRAMKEGMVSKANFFTLGTKIKESNLFSWYLLKLIQTSQSLP